MTRTGSTRCLLVATGAALLGLWSLGGQTTAWARSAPPPAPATSMAPLVTALQAEAGAQVPATGLTPGNWRSRLAPTLDRMAALQTERPVSGPVQGSLLAGTLHLPATVELAGDTTIVARHLALADRHLRIVAHGHTVHFYPIANVTAPAPAGRPQSAARAGVAAVTASQITIDASGAPGQRGGPGSFGFSGIPGQNGEDGRDANNPGDPQDCYGGDGQDGDSGGSGTDGDFGANGVDGQNGGTITFDVPAGSTDSYTFTSNGGDGGDGGKGGDGGCGGGNGGNGGWGGAGGYGGLGGAAGRGGDGGSITVTVPAGTPAAISTSVSGGHGGAGGPGGSGASGGGAGKGGMWGDGPYLQGQAGRDGTEGPDGLDGHAGDNGANGQDGTAQVIQT